MSIEKAKKVGLFGAILLAISCFIPFAGSIKMLISSPQIFNKPAGGILNIEHSMSSISFYLIEIIGFILVLMGVGPIAMAVRRDDIKKELSAGVVIYAIVIGLLIFFSFVILPNPVFAFSANILVLFIIVIILFIFVTMLIPVSLIELGNALRSIFFKVSGVLLLILMLTLMYAITLTFSFYLSAKGAPTHVPLSSNLDQYLTYLGFLSAYFFLILGFNNIKLTPSKLDELISP
jgi:uncharacterized membrane protein